MTSLANQSQASTGFLGRFMPGCFRKVPVGPDAASVAVNVAAHDRNLPPAKQADELADD